MLDYLPSESYMDLTSRVALKARRLIRLEAFDTIAEFASLEAPRIDLQVADGSLTFQLDGPPDSACRGPYCPSDRCDNAHGNRSAGVHSWCGNYRLEPWETRRVHNGKMAVIAEFGTFTE